MGSLVRTRLRRADGNDVLDARLGSMHELVESALSAIDVVTPHLDGRREHSMCALREGLSGLGARIDTARTAVVGHDEDAAAKALVSALVQASLLGGLLERPAHSLQGRSR